MVASSSNPVRFRARSAAQWVSLLAIAACSSPNDFFERPMGAGGSAAGIGGSMAASGGAGAISGGGGTSAGSGGSSVGAGNGGNAGSGNSTGAGATGGSEPGTGGTSDGQGGDGGESGDVGAGGTGGASGSAGEGAAGTQGDAGRSGSGGSSAEGGASSGGTSAGMSGGGGLAGVGGVGGVGGIGGISGAGGIAGGGKGGKGGCGSQPEVCDGENNNCTGGADEGGVCPSGCQGATEEGRIYVFCSGNSYSGSWQTAESRCQGAIATAAGIAMKLAVIETEDENEFLAEWVEDRNPANGAWMGANDLDVEDEWAWGTGPSRVPFYRDEGEGNNGEVIMNRYNDWGNGRPNGDTAMQDDEDCGHFDPVYNWRWNDRRCGDVLPAFVCEQSP